MKIHLNEDVKVKRKISGVYKLEVPMYRCHIEILFKDATDKLKKFWKNEGNYGGVTYDYLENDRSIIISFPSDKPLNSTAVHELCHATQMILKNAGHPFGDIDEPFAYLLTFLVEEYEEIHKKHLKKLKKK